MKKYPSIKYPTHEKTDGLLTEGDEIVIQEKVDGANFRYTVDEDGEITFGSRNCVNPDEQFEHAEEYVERTLDFDSLSNYDDFEDIVFFGEAMHKHSIDYDAWEGREPDIESDFPNVIGFDIWDDKIDDWMDFDMAMNIFEDIGFETAPIICRKESSEITEEDKKVPESEYRNPDPDAESDFNRRGLAEGIVIRNIDKDIRAKVVHDEFKEKNAMSFNDKSKAQTEAGKFVATYVTDARVEKMIYKLVDEGEYDSPKMPMMEDLPRRVIEDVFEEEGWNFICNREKVEIELDKEGKSEIRSKASDKCARILKEIVNDW